MTLHESVALYAAALAADDFTSVPVVPQALLSRVSADLETAAKARYGIQRVAPTVLEPARWTVPAGAEDAPVGTMVRVPFSMTLRPEASRVVPGSFVETTTSPMLRTLVGRQGKPITYAGVSFLRRPDGSWAKSGELAAGAGRTWTDAGICPHGCARGVAESGLALRVLKTSRSGDRLLHRVHLVNNGAEPLVVSTHRWVGAQQRRIAVRLDRPAGGFPLPPGWDLVVPLARPRDQRWTGIGGSAEGSPWVWLVSLPLDVAAGHPGADGWCPGEQFHQPTWLGGAEAYTTCRQEVPLPEEVCLRFVPQQRAPFDAIYAFEDAVEAVTFPRGLGGVESHEVAADLSDARIYVTGPDARRLLAAIAPLVREHLPAARLTMTTAAGDESVELPG